MKLTKQRVEAARPPQAGQTFYWDDEMRGFGLRVTAAGSRSYVAQGRVGTVTRRVTIGSHGRWTCEEARRQAREFLRDMDLGIDPHKQRLQARAAGTTLRELVDAYLRDRKLKPNSQKDIRKHLQTTLATWADRPAASISRDEVLTRFRAATERSCAQANQAFVILRALLNYGRAAFRAPDGTALFPENPVAVLSEAKLWNKERPRTTRISPDRIGAAWYRSRCIAEAARTEHERTAADYVSFLLLSGARGSEGAELEWERVNLPDEGVCSWHLPDPKNGRPVTFPLSSALASILRERRSACAAGERYVFACWGKAGHVMDARSVLNKIGSAVGLRITRHDLRRTFTGLALHSGLEMWKTELLTGHVPQSVTLKHYMETEDLRYLAPELESMTARVLRDAEVARSIAEGENVVALRA